MKLPYTKLALFSISLLLSSMAQAQAQAQTSTAPTTYPTLPSETPEKFTAPTMVLT